MVLATTDQRTARPSVGGLLRSWRERRRLSQLALSADAGVSTRHLSYVETGRSRPSRELVLHLAEHLDVPLRERNALLLAAGYAPAYGERSFDAPELHAVRQALDLVLTAHEPYPALVVDGGWNLVSANRPALVVLADGVAPWLLEPPANVLRATLHPDGMAPRISNLPEWSGDLLARLRREADASGDARLHALYAELIALPGVAPEPPPGSADLGAVAVPLRLRWHDTELALLSTIATFGTALDVTLAELALEAFLPADPDTATALRAVTEGASP